MSKSSCRIYSVNYLFAEDVYTAIYSNGRVRQYCSWYVPGSVRNFCCDDNLICKCDTFMFWQVGGIDNYFDLFGED